MVTSDHHSGHVRDDETDEADDAREGHANSGEQRGEDEHASFHESNVHSQLVGLVVPEEDDVQLPGVDQDDDGQHADDEQDYRVLLKRGVGEIPE